MRCQETGKRSYSTGLSEFVDGSQIEALFTAEFGSRKVIERKRAKGEKQYRLDVEGSERVYRGLVPGLAVQDNVHQTRLYIDWGKEQQIAEQVFDIYLNGIRPFKKGGNAYNEVAQILKTVRTWLIYPRGPEPVYSYESRNLVVGIEKVLEMVTGAEYHNMFMQSIGSSSDHRGYVHTHVEIVFSKFERPVITIAPSIS